MGHLTLSVALRFAQPLWLPALVAAAAPPLLAWRGRRHGRYVPATSVVLQCVAVALAAMALARPQVRLGDEARKPYLVIQDTSASVGGQQLALDWPADLPQENWRFARTVSPAGEAAPVEHERSATHAAPVLRLAAARADEISGVVIATDGQFDDGADWPAAAAALGNTGLPVHIVPLEAPPADARLIEFTARRAGQEVELRVSAAATTAVTKLLTVRRERPTPRTFAPKWLNLLPPGVPGNRATVLLSDDAAPADAAAVYVAELSGGEDALPGNNRLSAVVLPRRQTVTWMGPKGAVRDGVADRLARKGVRLETVRSEQAPRDPSGWASYSAVVLVEAGGPLGPDSRAALADYVRAGGGLVQIGAGPHATPRDRDDPVNRIAALVANPYDRKPLKAIVVLDASGSMAEPAAADERRQRFDLAAQSVLALRRHLTADDALAVVTFSNVPRLVYDSAPGEIDFGALQRAITAVRPAGKTIVLPALEQIARVALPGGYEGLALLVSDLRAERFDPSEAARLFEGGRLRLGIIATGDPSPEQASVRAMAERLGATIRRASDLSALAGVFAQFLAEQRGEALQQGRFELNAPGDRALGIEAASLPPLPAYYLSAAEQGAEVLLRIHADPVLALRRSGIGTCISLAAPVRALPDDETMEALLAAAVQRVIRRAEAPGFTGRAWRDADGLRVEVTAHDPARLPERWPLDRMDLTAEALVHAGTPRRVESPLLQTAPGRYEGRGTAGRRAVSLAVRDAAGATVFRAALGETYPQEYARPGANREALRRLATLTGGRLVTRGELPELAAAWSTQGHRDLWLHLLAAAVAVMLLEWVITRVRRQT